MDKEKEKQIIKELCKSVSDDLDIYDFKNFYVIEAEHHNPNDQSTMVQSTRKMYGPFSTPEAAEEKQKELMMKNVDNYYHKAWVIERGRDLSEDELLILED